MKLEDKEARLGACGVRGALVVRPRALPLACPEHAFGRQRACLPCALVHWGLLLRFHRV